MRLGLQRLGQCPPYGLELLQWKGALAGRLGRCGLGPRRRFTAIVAGPARKQLLDSAKHIPDEEYAKCGLNPEETAGLKSRMTAWANEIRTREANPDIDQSMRLLQTGHAMPGQGQAVSSNGEAAQRRSPYEQGRGLGERGS